MKTTINVLLSVFITACSNILDDSFNKEIEVANFDKTYIARLYADMYGGATGGIDYIITIQKADEKSKVDKNIVFKSSISSATICLKWIDNNRLSIITDASSYKFNYFDINFKIDILYSTSIEDFNKYKSCIGHLGHKDIGGQSPP